MTPESNKLMRVLSYPDWLTGRVLLSLVTMRKNGILYVIRYPVTLGTRSFIFYRVKT